jgi:hypothetical protein
VIGKNANDYFNNVSQLEINNAYKPSQGMMLLSKALGAYATGALDGGASGTINPVEIVDKSHLLNSNTPSLLSGSPSTGGLFRTA